MENSLKTFVTSLALTILFLISTNQNAFITQAKSYHKTINPKNLNLGSEKLSHLHFYFHDIESGKNPTAVLVASAKTTNTSSTGFGQVYVMDNLLTVGPDRKSDQVGSAQGIYALASQSEYGLLMVHTYVFTAGKLNGSTLSVLGRKAGLHGDKELPIVGGSGLFRFSRGYAMARNHMFDGKSVDAIIEYNVYVWHY